MKDLFNSYYPLKEEQLQLFWKDSLFVFDTNAILNVFRVKPLSASNILNILEENKDRIFIPHHVALEYHRNYQEIMCEHRASYQSVESSIKEGIDNLIKSIDGLSIKNRHPIIDSESIKDDIVTFRNDILDKINTKKTELNIEEHCEDILLKLEFILQDCVGLPFNKESLEIETKEAAKRFEQKRPPGFKDEDKDKHFYHDGLKYMNMYGDYFIWRQIILHCNEHKVKNLIFITNENKEDWWHKSKGQKIGPRKELIDEIQSSSSVENFKIYNESRFFEELKNFNPKSTSAYPETLNEIHSVNELFDNRGENYFQANKDNLNFVDRPSDIYRLHDMKSVEKIEILNRIEQIKSKNRQTKTFSELMLDKGKTTTEIEVLMKLNSRKKRYIEEMSHLNNLIESTFYDVSSTSPWENEHYQTLLSSKRRYEDLIQELEDEIRFLSK